MQNLNHTTISGASSLSETFMKMAKNPQKSAVVEAYSMPYILVLGLNLVANIFQILYFELK